MTMFKKNGGFTLVELIVVIAILAILAGVAVPVYSGYIAKANEAADYTQLDAVKTATFFAVTEADPAATVEKIEIELIAAVEDDEETDEDETAAATYSIVVTAKNNGEEVVFTNEKLEEDDTRKAIDLGDYFPGNIEFKSNNTKAAWYAVETAVTEGEETVTYKAGWNLAE